MSEQSQSQTAQKTKDTWSIGWIVGGCIAIIFLYGVGMYFIVLSKSLQYDKEEIQPRYQDSTRKMIEKLTLQIQQLEEQQNTTIAYIKYLEEDTQRLQESHTAEAVPKQPQFRMVNVGWRTKYVPVNCPPKKTTSKRAYTTTLHRIDTLRIIVEQQGSMMLLLKEECDKILKCKEQEKESTTKESDKMNFFSYAAVFRSSLVLGLTFVAMTGLIGLVLFANNRQRAIITELELSNQPTLEAVIKEINNAEKLVATFQKVAEKSRNESVNSDKYNNNSPKDSGSAESTPPTTP